jgi:hypothetical protein
MLEEYGLSEHALSLYFLHLLYNHSLHMFLPILTGRHYFHLPNLVSFFSGETNDPDLSILRLRGILVFLLMKPAELVPLFFFSILGVLFYTSHGESASDSRNLNFV